MQMRLATTLPLIAIVLAACSDQRAPTSPSEAPAGGSSPLFAISDGAHSGGNPNFFFLPPLQPSPRKNPNFDRGGFNPNLSPTVKICDGRDLTSQGECVKPLLKNGQPVVFTAVRGWDGLPDWIDPEQYHVLWQTRAYGLGTGKPYRVLVKVGSTLLGFLDIVPTKTLLNALRITVGGQDVGWLQNSIVPIRFRIEQGALCGSPQDCTEVKVGSEGGDFTLPSKYAGLSVPVGAVKSGDTVTIVVEKENPQYDGQCLPTDLVQSKGCYHFRSEPPLYQFTKDVRLEACVDVLGLTDEQVVALQLYKYNATEGLQALPRVEPTLIDCTNFIAMVTPAAAGPTDFAAAALHQLGDWAGRLLAPRPLYASMPGNVPHGIGGTGGSFSDVGGAVPAAVPAKLAFTVQPTNAAVGRAITPAVQVAIQDALGSTVTTATNTVTLAGGFSPTSDTVVAAVDGVATFPSLIINIPGPHMIYATASGLSTAASNTFTITFQCSAVTEISTPECEALVALYNATAGPNWVDHTGWLQTNTPCSTPWKGVGCGPAGSSVLYLELGYNNLTGALPAQLSDLQNLVFLHLFGNHLSGPIPATLGSLGHLEQLVANGNQLSGPIPAELGTLGSLRNLTLNQNQLTGPIPAALGSLSHLQVLALNENHLSGAIPAALGALSSLNTLLLQLNDLSGLVPLAVAQLGGGIEQAIPGSCDLDLGNQVYMPDQQDYRAADLNGDRLICGVGFTSLPDLVVSDVNLQTTRVNPGGLISFDYTISNIGGEGPAGNSTFDVAVYLSSDPVLDAADVQVGQAYSAWTYHLSVGWSQTNNLMSDIPIPVVPPGTYYLIVVADAFPGQPPNNYPGVVEANENNNWRASPTTVTVVAP